VATTLALPFPQVKGEDAHVQVSDDPRVGTELAGYRIMSLLGLGGMSVVYVAEDLRLKRKVALKLLASSLAGDESFRDRFLHESELAASIDHPNIVPIYEAGDDRGAALHRDALRRGTRPEGPPPMRPPRPVGGGPSFGSGRLSRAVVSVSSLGITGLRDLPSPKRRFLVCVLDSLRISSGRKAPPIRTQRSSSKRTRRGRSGCSLRQRCELNQG
jgi:serine/threonine protein kinase